ncbi:hypothetical protein NIES4071_38070 [Calothrix sp. NIES-4071]|nr:hypothetical protein NIES4071_38070 [Calothrix sp. NIES-4071]BAZ58124.1 hypothetical protein NIES4105_38000 [Calothrix sp. NIES-4105]
MKRARFPLPIVSKQLLLPVEQNDGFTTLEAIVREREISK